MRDRAVIVAPGAGWEFDVPTRSVPSWVVEMSDEWRGSFKRFPRASIASMSGLAPIRAQKLLDGNVAPTPTEAATMDAALGTDASRLLPPRRPFVQGTALSIVAGRPRPPRTPP